MKMRTIRWLVLIPALAIGCKSNPFSDRDGSAALVVDDDFLVDVPESDRADIAVARTERSEMRDLVAIAERNVEQGRRQLDVAEEELAAAEAAVRTAEKSLAVAGEDDESVRASEIGDANRRLEGARARKHWARSKVAYQGTHISRLESQTDLARLRLEWSEARVELAKARAVHELDRPEARALSVGEFEARVAEKQVEVAMAEIDAQAWEKKAQVRQHALDDRLAGLSETRERHH
ncbi:MAG TPA: hypothetical protein VF530_06365 [Planctomycetota bacterium]